MRPRGSGEGRGIWWICQGSPVTSIEGLDGHKQELVRGHQHEEDTTSVSQSGGVPAIENSRDSECKKE